MTSSITMRPALSSWDVRVSLWPCRLTKGIVRSSPRRRYLLTAKKKGTSDKVKKLQKICDGVEEQLSILQSELVTMKAVTEEQSKVDQKQELQFIAQELLDRQETFFKEERQHWITERTEWRNQETKLLNEITRLQSMVMGSHTNEQTTKPHTHSSSSLENTPPSASKRVDESAKDTGKTEPMTSSPALLNAEDTPSVPDVGATIAAAMSAVNEADVLSDDFQDYLKTAINGTAVQSDAADDAPIENIKSPPTGPPPSLTTGDDDIYWVYQLQESLVRKGYFCGEDDTEDYYFGEGTFSALLTFQACNGLEETGITDISTWKALLGEDMKPMTDPPTDTSNKQTVDTSTAPIQVPSAESSDDAPSQPTENGIGDSNGDTVEDASEGFPVLSEFDGGADVHCLQVMLEIVGFSCGKDDMLWWHYGDDTINALKTFQACNGLPQSGVSDKKTWETLVGSGVTWMDVRKRVQEEHIYEEDLSQSDRVWLLGEQRWERKL